MAKEKTKEDFLFEIARIRSKRKKNPTMCSDQRRTHGHCGMCGSEDIAFQGVDHCQKCGNEKEVLFLDDWVARQEDILECCYEEYQFTFRGVIHKGKGSLVKRYGIRVCLVCGAIERPACPNCKQIAWHKGIKKYCQYCGYRI